MAHAFLSDNRLTGLTIKEQILIENMLLSVCDYFCVTKEGIVSKSRRRPIVNARCAFSTILYRHYNSYRKSIGYPELSLAEVGSFIGSRDHATIHRYIVIVHPNLMDTEDRDYCLMYSASERACKEMMTSGLSSAADRLKEINIMLGALSEERHQLLREIESNHNQQNNGTEQPATGTN